MDILTGIIFAVVAAAIAGVICLALVNKQFPEYSKREKSRQAAAKARESQGQGLKETIAAAGNRLSKILPAKAEDEAEYRDKLAMAGLAMQPETWNGVRMLSVIVFGGGALVLVIFSAETSIPLKIVAGLAGAVGGWFVPQLFLWAIANGRREELEKELPSMLELLALSVKAGYPLSHGIKLVGKVGKGELAKEFRTVDADINLLGMDVSRALERMNARCGSETVAAFCSAVVQAQRQGTSVTRILASQAKLARNEQYARTMQKINALANKMTPIVILVFIPLIVAIVLVPSFVNIIGQLGSW